MSIKKTYAVFGLGRYGAAVAKELAASGADTLAVDINEANVASLASELPFCKCADITDADVIKQLGVSNVDVVIVCMAGNLEASVMAITLCKEAGVETVIAKCGSETHKKIFKSVGADKVVFPESESGVHLAKSLISSGFVDLIELSNEVSMVDMDVPKDWVGKSLAELNVRKKYGINVVAVKKGASVQIDIDPSAPLSADASLVVIANTERLKKLK